MTYTFNDEGQITGPFTSEDVSNFAEGWNEADKAGLEGNRIRAGLLKMFQGRVVQHDTPDLLRVGQRVTATNGRGNTLHGRIYERAYRHETTLVGLTIDGTMTSTVLDANEWQWRIR
ncbi:hypothetical protein SEA_YELLOWPANDA_18 [Microbacterium phage YellowPanda]